FVVFHILGPSIASLDEIAETASYLGDAKYFMVKNFIKTGSPRPRFGDFECVVLSVTAFRAFCLRSG
ncbi:MAG: hypothetical protein WBZ35_23585, partial [Pseudolabrys sp.]